MNGGAGGHLRGRWLVVAAGSRALAERFASEHGVETARVLEKGDLRSGPLRLRALARSQTIDGVLLHSVDWSAQLAPQLFALAAVAVPRKPVVTADTRTNSLICVSRRRLARQSARIPSEALSGALLSARETVRFILGSLVTSAVARPAKARTTTPAVLVVWLGAPEARVGGSVTHISGILKGFRAAGLRIGLVTNTPPPEQLAAVVDDVELTRPLSRGARLTSLVEGLCSNEAVREAGATLAHRLSVEFVYQRHRAYLLAGHELAHSLGRPLVLEFNASETWHRAHWVSRVPGERLLEPLLRAMEKRALAGSALVAAVSARAADMARELGTPAERVEVIPNGVDFDEVERAQRKTQASASADLPAIGWIGSFGPWHGAEILVRASARLNTPSRVLLIGDGPERSQCYALARSLGVLERVEFTGELPHQEALRLLSACDVLASPHVQLDGVPFFGSPTKLFEYMAIGRPIVASELEQLGEMLADGRTAVLVEPGNPDALARGIDSVLARPDRGAALGREARSQALRLHTWEQRARVILDHRFTQTSASESLREG